MGIREVNLRRAILLLFILCGVGTVNAQSFNANLTAASTDCSATSSCLIVNVAQNNGGATFTLAGTFMGTTQFEATANNGTSWVALSVTPSNSSIVVTSATATGVWQANVAGYTRVRIRVSTYTSGTFGATISTSLASARNVPTSGAAPGGAAGGDLSGTYPDPVVAQVNGAVVPASATVAATNASRQVTTAALANTNIYVGNGSNLPVGVAVSGDATLANTGALTLANTAVTPASYTNSSITVDSKGRITTAASGSAPVLSSIGNPSGNKAFDLSTFDLSFTNTLGSSLFLANAGPVGMTSSNGANAVAMDTTGGDGRDVTITSGNGGTSTGSADNAPAGNITIQLGSAGTGGAGMAGFDGNFSLYSSDMNVGLFLGADGVSFSKGAQSFDVGTSVSTSFGPMTTSQIAVGSLPAAAGGNAGWVRVVSDSTAVVVEGQTCVGMGAAVALAFSNGVVWKCF